MQANKALVIIALVALGAFLLFVITGSEILSGLGGIFGAIGGWFIKKGPNSVPTFRGEEEGEEDKNGFIQQPQVVTEDPALTLEKKDLPSGVGKDDVATVIETKVEAEAKVEPVAPEMSANEVLEVIKKAKRNPSRKRKANA